MTTLAWALLSLVVFLMAVIALGWYWLMGFSPYSHPSNRPPWIAIALAVASLVLLGMTIAKGLS